MPRRAPRVSDSASIPRRAVTLLRLAASLRRLPPRVAVFYVKALRAGRRVDDDFGLVSGTRPRELAQLLDVARGHRNVVELGTGSAWTAIALALSDSGRRVVSYDPVARPHREVYLELVPANVRRRIELVEGRAEDGPAEGASADLVFVDSSHERDETVATFEAWSRALAPGGIMAFHDWEEPLYPGVTEAIRSLGLRGEAHGYLFVWRKDQPDLPA